MGQEHDIGIDGLVDVELLGAGGSATVYRAYQERLNRPVAVKVMKTTADEATYRRFQREAAALGSMSEHPGIVTVYDADLTDDERPFFIMQLCDSGSLDDLLKSQGRVDERNASAICGAVARTLADAHGHGIYHRDIKPENILIGPGNRPLVADFGIAGLNDHPDGWTQSISLTPGYGPPEAFRHEPVTEKGDVYSVGATLFALLTGNAPYADEETGRLDLNVVAARISSGEQMQPRDYGISESVAQILDGALAYEPEDRPTMTELAAMLDREAKGTIPNIATELAPMPRARPKRDTPAPVPAVEAELVAASSSAGKKKWFRIVALAGFVSAAGVLGFLYLNGSPPFDRLTNVATEPAPTAIPTPTTVPTRATAEVGTGGADAFDTIPQALEALVEGGTLTIGEGEYTLDRNLIVNRPVTIRGAGAERTTLIAERAGDAAIEIRGNHRVELEDLRLEGSKDFASSLIQVSNALLSVDQIIVANAGQHGLLAFGSATVVIDRSVFADNGADGVRAGGDTTVQILSSQALNNGEVGFHWADTSTGIGNGNDAIGNLQFGYRVSVDANVDLESNTASDGNGSGFAWTENATGTADDNIVTDISGAAFFASGTSSPRLVENTAQGALVGFRWVGEATGSLTRNTATGNKAAGFDMRDKSSPIAERNTSQENARQGFNLSGETSAVLTENTASMNGTVGFRVTEQARPELRSNSATENPVGFFWTEAGAGVGMDNTAESNTAAGYRFAGTSRPELSSNIAKRNGTVGFEWVGQSRGVATGNQSLNHPGSGFLIAEQAQPELSDNTAGTNSTSGFRWEDSASGSSTGDQASGNSRDGFSIADSAAPRLSKNTANGNLRSGFTWSSAASGSAQSSTARQNAEFGFEVLVRAAPTLSDNVAADNGSGGYDSDRNTRPTLIANQFNQ